MMKGKARSALVTIEATSRACLVEVGVHGEAAILDGVQEGGDLVGGDCTGRAGAGVGGLLRV
jgi:hypothetical protein